MVGFGPDARSAQLALLELGTDVCLPSSPRVRRVPAAAWCRSRDGLRLEAERLGELWVSLLERGEGRL